MDTLKLILLIFQMISCVVLTVVIILQNGAEDGLGAIAGGSDTYLGKGKARHAGREALPPDEVGRRCIRPADAVRRSARLSVR